MSQQHRRRDIEVYGIRNEGDWGGARGAGVGRRGTIILARNDVVCSKTSDRRSPLTCLSCVEILPTYHT